MKITSVTARPYSHGEDRHPMYKRMRVHFSFNETIVENLFNRHYRPKKALRELLPEVFAKAGVHPDAIHACVRQSRWSQKAGCSCGCSPGFIVDNLAGRQLFVRVD